MTQKKKEEKKDGPTLIKITNGYLLRATSVAVNQTTGASIIIDPVVRRVRTELSFPFKIQYWVSRVFDKMTSEAQSLQKDVDALTEKYAKKDEKGEKVIEDNIIQFEDEDKVKLNEEYAKIMQQEIELPMTPLEPDFDKMPEMTDAEMQVLLPLLKDAEQ